MRLTIEAVIGGEVIGSFQADGKNTITD